MSALVQALSRLADNRTSDGVSSLVSPEDREAIITGCHDLMVASRSAALSSRSVEAGKPVVKAKTLVWSDVADPWPMEGMRDAEAVTEIGTYTISADQPSAGGTCYLWLAGNDSDEHDSEHRTMSGAEAAAQADYESRIRSALDVGK